jgi:hypothetical protein
MDSVKPFSSITLSRRGVFRGALLAAGGGVLVGAGLGAVGAAAQVTKRTQKMVQYQDTPKGRSRCDACSQWQAPDACKIVAGTISPSGWCVAFAPKP